MLRKQKLKNNLSKKHEAPGSNPGPSTILQSSNLKPINKKENSFSLGLKFILYFGIYFLLFYFVFYLLNINELLSWIAGNISVYLLTLLNISTNLSYPTWSNGYPVINGTINSVSFSAELVQLCAGGLELSVIWAAILSTSDRSLLDRIKGIILALFVILVFNPLRITLTLLLMGSAYLPLFHDLLFRALLIIVILGTYAFWYY